MINQNKLREIQERLFKHLIRLEQYETWQNDDVVFLFGKDKTYVLFLEYFRTLNFSYNYYYWDWIQRHDAIKSDAVYFIYCIDFYFSIYESTVGLAFYLSLIVWFYISILTLIVYVNSLSSLYSIVLLKDNYQALLVCLLNRSTMWWLTNRIEPFLHLGYQGNWSPFYIYYRYVSNLNSILN